MGGVSECLSSLHLLANRSSDRLITPFIRSEDVQGRVWSCSDERFSTKLSGSPQSCRQRYRRPSDRPVPDRHVLNGSLHYPTKPAQAYKINTPQILTWSLLSDPWTINTSVSWESIHTFDLDCGLYKATEQRHQTGHFLGVMTASFSGFGREITEHKSFLNSLSYHTSTS